MPKSYFGGLELNDDFHSLFVSYNRNLSHEALFGD